MVSRLKSEDSPKRRRPPARTPDAREQELIALAYDEAERQMRSGTASSQVLNHFLKMGSSTERLQQDRLRVDVSLGKAKVDQIASTASQEKIYTEALEAMKRYSGKSTRED